MHSPGSPSRARLAPRRPRSGQRPVQSQSQPAAWRSVKTPQAHGRPTSITTSAATSNRIECAPACPPQANAARPSPGRRPPETSTQVHSARPPAPGEMDPRPPLLITTTSKPQLARRRIRTSLSTRLNSIRHRSAPPAAVASVSAAESSSLCDLLRIVGQASRGREDRIERGRAELATRGIPCEVPRQHQVGSSSVSALNNRVTTKETMSRRSAPARTRRQATTTASLSSRPLHVKQTPTQRISIRRSALAIPE